LSDPQVLSKLLKGLDEAVSVPPQEELDALFSQLRTGTLGVVLGYLRQVQSEAVRSALEKAATRLASMNTRSRCSPLIRRSSIASRPFAGSVS
jgi:hypothetical protein